MKKRAFTAEDLPDVIPVFPLTGVLLLPRGRLPLNIFEPRYLAMIEDALATRHRLIGMIQPLDPDDRSRSPDLCRIGCAGRITQMEETSDGRYLVTLTGVSRFEITDELPLHEGYRPVRAGWDAFGLDLKNDPPGLFDRPRLLKGLRAYLDMQGVAADWNSIESAPDEPLITTLAMVCPFAPGEKQVLLEAANNDDRASTMIALIEMALAEKGLLPGDSTTH